MSKLINPPRTLQDRLRNAEWLAAGECPLYGTAADEIDRLLLRLGRAVAVVREIHSFEPNRIEECDACLVLEENARIVEGQEHE